MDYTIRKRRNGEAVVYLFGHASEIETVKRFAEISQQAGVDIKKQYTPERASVRNYVHYAFDFNSIYAALEAVRDTELG